MLSSGGCRNVEQLAICQDHALGCIKLEGRVNLDSLAGCGIIVCEHLFHFRNRPVAAGRFRFFVSGLSPRRVLAVERESKTGAAMGKSQDSARFDL